MSNRINAKARGRSYELRLADMGDGTIWPGSDGDVDIHGHRVEAKYRRDLTGLRLLASFIEQAMANGKTAGKPWALAVTGGKSYQNGQTYIIIPWDEWDTLQRQVKQLYHFQKMAPALGLDGFTTAVANSLKDAAYIMAQDYIVKEYMDADDLPDSE